LLASYSVHEDVISAPHQSAQQQICVSLLLIPCREETTDDPTCSVTQNKLHNKCTL